MSTVSTDVVCFHNPDEENGYLSNWYHSDFEKDGVTFSSMEQFMMYNKALCFHDVNTVRNLLLSFPAASEALSFNPAGVLSCLHIPKDATLPSVYSASEVSATLAAIDRDAAPERRST